MTFRYTRQSPCAAKSGHYLAPTLQRSYSRPSRSDSFQAVPNAWPEAQPEDGCPMPVARGTNQSSVHLEVFVFRICFAYIIVTRPYRTGLGLDTIPLLGSQRNVAYISGKVGSRQPHKEGNWAAGINSARPERRRTVRRCPSKTRRSKRIHQQPYGRTHGRPHS
jgi:hypothetical protein